MTTVVKQQKGFQVVNIVKSDQRRQQESKINLNKLHVFNGPKKKKTLWKRKQVSSHV